MEDASQFPQLGVSVHTLGSLQASIVSSQTTPRTCHGVNSTPNMTFTQTQNLAQLVFQQAGKVDEMQTKYLTTTPQLQPVVIGNVNAGNILTTALANRGGHAMVLPSNVARISPIVNTNSLIGLVPVVLQQGANGVWFQPDHRPGEIKSSPMVIPQNVGGCVSVNSSASVRPAESALSQEKVLLPHAVKIASTTTSQQPGLSSADTVILHSLASQDTIKIPSQSVSDGSGLNVPQQSLSMNLNSSFSLLSNVSERSVSLTSIPTGSLFSPEQSEDKNENMPVPFTSPEKSNNVQSNQVTSDAKATRNDSSLPHCSYSGVEPEKKKRQERMSESEPCQLQIDESADTDMSDVETKDSEVSETGKRNLTRDATVILNEEPEVSKENIPSVNNSDTVILQNPDGLERDKSKSSEGFNPGSIYAKSASSIENDEAISTSKISNTLLSSQEKQNTTIKLNSFPSIPSVILTDSIVNGTLDPNLLCGLFSQPTIIQQPSFFTHIASDQGEKKSLTGLTPLQSTCAGPATVQVCRPQSSQPVEENLINVNSSSAKGTQTDWVFGNAPVCFKPVTSTEEEHGPNKNSESVVESSTNEGNIPTSEVLSEDNEDITNGPIILDEQAVPASVLNLIPPHVDLFNSTANSPEANNTSTTNVHNSQFTSSKPLFPCTDCDQAFLTKRELDKHIKEHKKVHKCDLCTSTFTRLGNYTRHRKIHNLQPESQNVYTCEHCKREFLQRCDLRRHTLIHTKQEPYRCDICGKGYIRHSDLVVHLRFHRKEKAFKCTLCDKSYFQSGDLSRHMRRIHKPNSQLTCGHCDRKYACETTLIRHMKVVHKDIILKTVRRLQDTDEDQSDANNQDVMFAVNDGHGNQGQHSQAF